MTVASMVRWAARRGGAPWTPGLGIETVSLGETLIDSFALLVDRGPLLVRLGLTPLSSDLLLLGLRGLVLGIQARAVGLELGLRGPQVTLLDRLMLPLGLLPQLGRAVPVLLVLPGAAPPPQHHAEHDQQCHDDQDGHGDRDDGGKVERHVLLLASGACGTGGVAENCSQARVHEINDPRWCIPTEPSHGPGARPVEPFARGGRTEERREGNERAS